MDETQWYDCAISGFVDLMLGALMWLLSLRSGLAAVQLPHSFGSVLVRGGQFNECLEAAIP